MKKIPEEFFLGGALYLCFTMIELITILQIVLIFVIVAAASYAIKFIFGKITAYEEIHPEGTKFGGKKPITRIASALWVGLLAAWLIWAVCKFL